MIKAGKLPNSWGGGLDDTRKQALCGGLKVHKREQVMYFTNAEIIGLCWGVWGIGAMSCPLQAMLDTWRMATWECWGSCYIRPSFHHYWKCFFYDMMHSKYLGSDSYFLGSLLSWLTEKKKIPLEHVWEDIKNGYALQRTSSRYTSLTANMFKRGKAPFPHLKGKASEIKGLMPVMLLICSQKYLNPDDYVDKLILKSLEQSVAIDKLLDAHKEFPALPADKAQMLQHGVMSFNRLVAALGDHLHPQSQHFFHYTIKCHVLDHIALDSSALNPTWTWNFSSEDYLLRVRKMVQSCAHGSGPDHIQEVFVRKWLRGYELHWWPSVAQLRWEKGGSLFLCLYLQDFFCF